MYEINADHGTVLPVDASALVVDGDGELNFLMPDGAANEEMPRMMRLLAAVLIKSRDVEWVDEMIASLDSENTN